MSIQAVAWALEQDLPARPKLVLVSIANHANHVDGYCWLKAETIAKEAACTPRSIYNFVGALIRNGFIRKALRRGDDGKQRATDYWILFEREEKPWDSAAHLDADADEGESEADENASGETEDATSCVPVESLAGGEPMESTFIRQPVDIPAGSCGPVESGFHHKDSAEPSESNSKASSARERVHRSTLRAYRPPPPQPVAEDTGLKKQPMFAFEGSPAYEQWAVVMARKNGIRTWRLTTRAFIEGKDGKPGAWRTGWYFPTLFPPSESTGPPQSDSNLPDSVMREFK